MSREPQGGPVTVDTVPVRGHQSKNTSSNSPHSSHTLFAQRTKGNQSHHRRASDASETSRELPVPPSLTVEELLANIEAFAALGDQSITHIIAGLQSEHFRDVFLASQSNRHKLFALFLHKLDEEWHMNFSVTGLLDNYEKEEFAHMVGVDYELESTISILQAIAESIKPHPIESRAFVQHVLCDLIIAPLMELILVHHDKGFRQLATLIEAKRLSKNAEDTATAKLLIRAMGSKHLDNILTTYMTIPTKPLPFIVSIIIRFLPRELIIQLVDIHKKIEEEKGEKELSHARFDTIEKFVLGVLQHQQQLVIAILRTAITTHEKNDAILNRIIRALERSKPADTDVKISEITSDPEHTFCKAVRVLLASDQLQAAVTRAMSSPQQTSLHHTHHASLRANGPLPGYPNSFSQTPGQVVLGSLATDSLDPLVRVAINSLAALKAAYYRTQVKHPISGERFTHACWENHDYLKVFALKELRQNWRYLSKEEQTLLMVPEAVSKMWHHLTTEEQGDFRARTNCNRREAKEAWDKQYIEAQDCHSLAGLQKLALRAIHILEKRAWDIMETYGDIAIVDDLMWVYLKLSKSVKVFDYDGSPIDPITSIIQQFLTLEKIGRLATWSQEHFPGPGHFHMGIYENMKLELILIISATPLSEQDIARIARAAPSLADIICKSTPYEQESLEAKAVIALKASLGEALRIQEHYPAAFSNVVCRDPTYLLESKALSGIGGGHRTIASYTDSLGLFNKSMPERRSCGEPIKLYAPRR